MADLIALCFDDANTANAVRSKILRLRRERLVNLSDFVVASRDAGGGIAMSRDINAIPAAASCGALVGALLGSLAGVTLGTATVGIAVGVLLGAILGGLLGRHFHHGLSEDFVQSASEHLKEGQTALFLPVRKFKPHDLYFEVTGHGGQVFRSSLMPQQTRKLQLALSSKPCELLL